MVFLSKIQEFMNTVFLVVSAIISPV